MESEKVITRGRKWSIPWSEATKLAKKRKSYPGEDPLSPGHRLFASLTEEEAEDQCAECDENNIPGQQCLGICPSDKLTGRAE